MPGWAPAGWGGHCTRLVQSGVLSNRQEALTCFVERHGAVRQLRLLDPHFTVSREAA